VDQVVEGSNPFAHPIDIGVNPLNSRATPVFGGGSFMLTETCAPFVRHFVFLLIFYGEDWSVLPSAGIFLDSPIINASKLFLYSN
jgi:hypothetical protein